jgi:SNF2 family DNA or RNA helicase
MVKEQREAYDGLKMDYYAFIEASGEEIAAFSDGGLHIKLCQATTGIPTLTGDPEAFGSCKLEALRELLIEREGAPVVAFCHFRATAQAVQALGRSLGRRVAVVDGSVEQAQRDLYVDDFQAGRIDLLVGTLATLAEGVTLTRSSTCIFVERSWRPSKNEQAMRRLHRIGQDAPVTVISIITTDSVDQGMTRRLMAKEAQAEGVLSAAEFARML